MAELAEVTSEGDHYALHPDVEEECKPKLPMKLAPGETARGWVMFEQSPKAPTTFHVAMTFEGPTPPLARGQKWWQRAPAPKFTLSVEAGEVR
jgi:hypothetical protein